MLQARTWAEVDLGALERNLARVRSAQPDDVDVMLVVKADAYGHGAIPVSWHLLKHGVACLGVGDSTEALELRAAGITAPIVILGAVVAGELEDVVRGNIAVTVHSGDRVRRLRRVLKQTGGRVGVHIKVDTGMGRLGCAPQRVPGIAREVKRSRGLVLEGISTHLAKTKPGGGPDAELQLKRFRRVLGVLEREGLLPPWRHVFASGGALSDLPSEFNLIRPGLAVFGIDPHNRKRTDLEPALSWRTQIVFLKDHRRGARIGYGGTWRAPRKVRIATLPVGYNDGYRFAFSNRAEVLVRGERCPVVGRVSMDYTTIDVTHVEGAEVGDVVTLMGRDGDAAISAFELARHAQTIPYEILCGMGRRVKRSYVNGGHGAVSGVRAGS
ncbi:MAG: alanine racemase [Planctomycetota bacterium]|nr:alanine racemase [Planctomycetota bacterium]